MIELVFTNGKSVYTVSVDETGFRKVRTSVNVCRGTGSLSNNSYGIDYCLSKGFILIGVL